MWPVGVMPWTTVVREGLGTWGRKWGFQSKLREIWRPGEQADCTEEGRVSLPRARDSGGVCGVA